MPGAGQDLGDRVRLAGAGRRRADQLGDRDLVHQAAALQHRADPPADDRLARGGAEDADRAAVGLLETEQQVEGGGLAGAVGAQERDGLARAGG